MHAYRYQFNYHDVLGQMVSACRLILLTQMYKVVIKEGGLARQNNVALM